MEIAVSLLQILLPAGLVLLGMYAAVRQLVQKDFEKKLVDLRFANSGTVLPLRLQAYERVALLLERTSPQNLVMRVNSTVYTAAQFQQQLVSEVREEYNHNLSQQIYISIPAWALVRNAIEETIGLINTSGQRVDPNAPSLDLARAIFESLIEREESPTDRAMAQIKEEVQGLF